MSLANALDAAEKVVPKHARPPTGFEPGVKYESGQPAEVILSLREVPEDEQAWREKIRNATSLTIPDERRVELTDVRYWGNPKEPMIYCRFKILDRDTATAEDIDDLVKAARRASGRKQVKGTTQRTFIAVLADAQVGKTGSRGGTPELLERFERARAGIMERATQLGCEDAVLLEAGDCIESVENTGSQLGTNDVSVPAQLRIHRRMLTELTCDLANAHRTLRVATVPSNHGAWRKGKNTLGTPRDDYGIENLIAVADSLELSGKYDHVSFVIPDVWDESIALEVRGQVIGLVHGHQVRNPNGIPQWWAKQTHGAGAVAAATILITGHFHHLRIEPTGTIPGTDQSKWWIQAPTLDNGSDWFRNLTGQDSQPGVLTFTVDEDGWHDLHPIWL